MIDISDNESNNSKSEYEPKIEHASSTNEETMCNLDADESIHTPDLNNEDAKVSFNREQSVIPVPDNEQSLKCPNRIVTFFLPPGFHNWTNAFRFVGEFFFFRKLSRRVAKAKGAMFGGATESMSRRQEMRIHEELIVLTKAEGEKMCICDTTHYNSNISLVCYNVRGVAEMCWIRYIPYDSICQIWI